MAERKLPIGIQSFEEIREEGYLYVDKTEYIWDLVNTGETYFLSRPRRFGKSLLISTISAYFQGKKELFKGLAIEKHENEKGKDAWQSYPVICFSLTEGKYQSDEGIQNQYSRILHETAVRYGVKVQIDNKNLSSCFCNLIKALYRKTGKQVVVLVDDYDRPVLDVMETNPEQAKKNEQFFIRFFSVLKDEDAYVKFSFITGITEFHNESVFGGLNQLRDISMSVDYAAVCGVTEKEMKDLFEPEIRTMSEGQHLTEEECIHELARMYDGYHFSENGEAVYNPFSLFNAFADRKFGSYWFDTGTPTFLIHKLRNSDFSPEDFTDGVEIGETQLPDYRPDNTNPIPLFFQTGYLTICGYRKRIHPGNGVYVMKFPNEEVRTGFLEMLAPYVIGNRNADDKRFFGKMAEDIENGDLDSFMKRLKVLFARIPYPDNHEKSYEWEWRNQVFELFVLLGENVQAEVHSSHGRADCIVETERYVCIFEFKLDQNVDDALKQIDEKGYAEPYLMDQRKVRKVGISFSSEKRNIDQWKSISLSNNS